MKKIVAILVISVFAATTAYAWPWSFGKPKEYSFKLEYPSGERYGMIKIIPVAKVKANPRIKNDYVFCSVKVIPKTRDTFLFVDEFPKGFQVFDAAGKELGIINCPEWGGSAFVYKESISPGILKDPHRAVFYYKQ